MEATSAILSHYGNDAWQSRILTGEPIQQVNDWIKLVESNPSVADNSSGKPLAWLILTTGSCTSDEGVQVIHSIGLMTDTLQTNKHELTEENLARLESIFQQFGKPFHAEQKEMPPFL